MRAVVFGANGGIGLATVNELKILSYKVFPINKNDVNFSSVSSDYEVSRILFDLSPEVVINCVGHFASNEEDHRITMDVNFGSNWSIIKHYINNPPLKQTRIVMVGSSSYKEGRKNYMCYAASKAATYNLWLSCNEYFENTKVSVSLINPAKTKTKMMDPTATRYLLPEYVAKRIIDATQTEGICIDLNYDKEY